MKYQCVLARHIRQVGVVNTGDMRDIELGVLSGCLADLLVQLAEVQRLLNGEDFGGVDGNIFSDQRFHCFKARFGGGNLAADVLANRAVFARFPDDDLGVIFVDRVTLNAHIAMFARVRW